MRLLLQRSIEKYETARRSGGTVIFDRGVPDCVVYAVRAGVDPAPRLAAIDEYRYQPQVLFLQPWSDINETDEERIMSFDDTVCSARRKGETQRDAYVRSGYTLVVVPNGSVEDRAAFIRMRVAK